MIDLARYLAHARAALEVGTEMVLQRATAGLTWKGDRDPVTETDLAVERTLRQFLAERTPEVAFLGEEEGRSNAQQTERLVWALDPVDGTVNFVHNLPLSAISLGLVQEGRPILGVIATPFLRSSYWAAEGQGAWCDGERLHVSTTSQLREAVVAVGDYAIGTDAQRKNRRRLALTAHLAGEVQRVRMMGSAAIDLAWMAQGRFDACLMLANKPWDTAAGVILAREAGALVLDEDGTDHAFESGATIAVTPGLRDQLLDLVRAS